MIDALIEELNGSFSRVPASVAAIRLLMAMLLGGIIGWEGLAWPLPRA